MVRRTPLVPNELHFASLRNSHERARGTLFSRRSGCCGGSPLQYRNEVSLALRAPAMAVEVRALFDREGHVMDIGFDMTGGLQGNRLRADDTQDCATHDHLLTRDHPRHPPLLTNENLGCLDVTLYVAIDLQSAATNNLEPPTDDREVVAYD